LPAGLKPRVTIDYGAHTVSEEGGGIAGALSRIDIRQLLELCFYLQCQASVASVPVFANPIRAILHRLGAQMSNV